MKALIRYTYGGPEVLTLEETKRPTVKERHILIEVRANSVNPADWHILRGRPFFARFTLGLFKPKNKILGADFAGTVKEVGQGVKKFKVGDQVFGEMLEGGAFAEYVSAPENVCGLMPESATYHEMACVPVAGLTALQALLTHGQLKGGESVLINGSSGGVGHFAVQIAKAYGVNVTAICSSRNTDFVKSIGADKVIAYDKECVHQLKGKYDLVLDTNGNLNFSDYQRMGKRGVMVGFISMRHMIVVLIKSGFSKFSLIQFTAEANNKDLSTLATLIEDGKVKPHIEKTYPHSKIPSAIEYIENMRTRGKVSISWEL